MARAAVKAKQAQAAQAQAAAKPGRTRRGHASGGNPNQDLFFTRLRRRQKWVFLVLAVLFAISFAALGVGSGTGGGLEQIFNGILGGSDPVSKANDEIKKNPNDPKGYKDLANAYVTKNDLAGAIVALQSYLAVKKTDSATWAQLGGYERQQADTYAEQYRQIAQATALAAPGTVFQPTGDLATQLGTNPIDQFYTQQNSALSSPLYQKATDGYNTSLTDYQNAAKYAKGRSDKISAEQFVANAAQIAGKTDVALAAWKRVVQLDPHASNLAQIEAQCKQLGGSCLPEHKNKKK